MVDFYVIRIRLGKIAIENVPEKWREDVRQVLGVISEEGISDENN